MYFYLNNADRYEYEILEEAGCFHVFFTVQEIVSQNSKNLKSYGYAKSENFFSFSN